MITPSETQAPAPKQRKNKPEVWRDARTVLKLTAEEFRHKGLSDGATLNLGDTCFYSCEFCYAGVMSCRFASKTLQAYNKGAGRTGKNRLGVRDVVTRRSNAVELLKAQLVKHDGTPRFADPQDNRVVFSATLVDPAATMELLQETAEACKVILENTHWQIRLLSKSSLLNQLIEKKLLPEKECRARVIFGFSTGTLDDRVAAAIETGTPMVSKRLQSLHWLQEREFRTYGMICPSLPQQDYDKFSQEICEAIRVDRCEHVWAEVINPRGKAFTRTLEALRAAGLDDDASRLKDVFSDTKKRQEYARATFLAHTKNVPPEKLRFLQYVGAASVDWWADQREKGAVLLGKLAVKKGLIAEVVRAVIPLTGSDVTFRDEREKIVCDGINAGLAAAKALHEIRSYKDGIIWRQGFDSFEAYCWEKWGYRKSHAYRLAECGDCVLELEHSPIGECTLTNENQVRALSKLPRDHWVPGLKEIKSANPEKELTGNIVTQGVQDYAEKHSIPLPSNSKKPRSPKKVAAGALEHLSKVVDALPEAEKIKTLLEKVRTLIG